VHSAKSHKQYTHHHFFNQTSACIKRTAVEFCSLVVFSTTLFTRSHIQRARSRTHARTHARTHTHTHTHRHTHPFNGPFSRTTWVGRYQKGKTNLDFTEARDSKWQWHQLGHMQVCTSLQTDNHTSTPSLSFLQAGCPSCHPTNSVKALKASCNQHKKTSFVLTYCKAPFFIIVINNISHFQINIQICSAVQAIQQQQRPFNGL